VLLPLGVTSVVVKPWLTMWVWLAPLNTLLVIVMAPGATSLPARMPSPTALLVKVLPSRSSPKNGPGV
jgi:hypothetical protein